MALAVQGAASAALAAGALPELKTIRAAVDYYTASVKTLEGKYVQKSTREPGQALPGLDTRDHRLETTFAADIARNCTYLDDRSSYYLTGKNGEKLNLETRLVRACDGSRSAHLFHTHIRSPIETGIPANLPLRLNLAAGNDIQNRYMPWDFCGLRFMGMGNLAVLVRDQAARVDGTEDVNGAQCVRIVVQRAGAGSRTIAWLDPKHDFLPRRVEFNNSADTDGSGNGPWRLMHRLDVSEFKKFPDAGGGNEKWFPVRMQARNWIKDIHDFEVVDLTINPRVDPARFSISPADLPDGVQVNDAAGPFKVSYTGNAKELWEERNRLFEEEDGRIRALLAPPRAPPAGPATDAAGLPVPPIPAGPGSTFNWPAWILAAVSVAVLAAGGLSVVRARSQRSK